MSCGTEPTIYIDGLQTCNTVDDSLKTPGGLVVTAIGSGDLQVLPAEGDPLPADGHVAVYDSASSPPIKWQAQSGGGGGGFSYHGAITADAFTITSTNNLDIWHIDAPGSISGTITDGATNGRRLIIVLKSIASGACTITPDTALVGGGTTITLDAAGQGVQLVWLGTAWALTPGGATVA